MGKSPAPESIRGSDDVLSAVQDFVDEQFGDEPLVLVGESYGGYLARAITRLRGDQVLGLALICSIGSRPLWEERTVPPHVALRVDPDVADAFARSEFADLAVVQTAETRRRSIDEVGSGFALADAAALERIESGYALSLDPESGPAYERPTLVLCGRQDSITGYADVYELLGHYPRATIAVLDRAGHNLQIEQPALLGALVDEWLDRVAEAA